MQNNTVLPLEEIIADLKRGRELGIKRVILSGGEPTAHPQYIEIVAMAKKLGYRRIQTVTNGRMFAYEDFLEKAISAGLDETTFSIHGHNANLHDALTRVKGSFNQTVLGLRNALGSQKLIVNIDIVINKKNVRYIHDIICFFVNMGVHEFDLLQITPFGDAWLNRGDVLYDPSTALRHLNPAFKLARGENLFIWTNRFPPQFLIPFPELIQNPYKLHDEVRGRAEMFSEFISHSRRMRCWGKQCDFCFMKNYCFELVRVRKLLRNGGIRSVMVSNRTAQKLSAFTRHGSRLVNVYFKGGKCQEFVEASRHFKNASAVTVDLLIPPSLKNWKTAAGMFPSVCIVVRSDFSPSLVEYAVHNSVRLQVILNRKSRNNIKKYVVSDKNLICSDHLIFKQENYLSLEETFKYSIGGDENLFAFLSQYRLINVPPCIIHGRSNSYEDYIDIDMYDKKRLIDMKIFTDYFIGSVYYVKSQLCGECDANKTCRGVHVNYLRAFGVQPKPLGN